MVICAKRLDIFVHVYKEYLFLRIDVKKNDILRFT
jgi:hypothetical protein